MMCQPIKIYMYMVKSGWRSNYGLCNGLHIHSKPVDGEISSMNLILMDFNKHFSYSHSHIDAEKPTHAILS